MTKPHRPKIIEKVFFFFSGIVASAPFPFLATTLVNYFLMFRYPAQVALIITVSVIAPLLEEFTKAFPLFYRHGETQRSLMTLGFLVGLGFGVAEFFFYVFILKTPFFLRLPAILFHASSTTIVAYGISHNQSARFYFLAVLLHGLGNLFLGLGGLWVFIALLVTLITYLLAFWFYRISKEEPIEHWL